MSNAVLSKAIHQEIAVMMTVSMPSAPGPAIIRGKTRFFTHAFLQEEEGRIEIIISEIAIKFGISIPDPSIWPKFTQVKDFVNYITKTLLKKERTKCTNNASEPTLSLG